MEPEIKDDPSNIEIDASAITPQVEYDEGQVVSHEEQVEYRDQDGNILDADEVASLMAEGLASFETKYETRTRLIDDEGNVVDTIIDQGGVAPDHPDVEGQNPSTKRDPEEQARDQPAEAKAGGSVKKEDDGEAKPASDASEATT